MAVSGRFYPKAFISAFNEEIDFTADTINGALVLNVAMDPADQYWADVTGEITGTGYSAGGQSLGTCAITYTAANSWGVSRADTTAYGLGAVVRPASANGYLYQATTAGTSGGSVPTYPTNIGGTVTDGTVVWTCVGVAIVALDDDGSNLSWAGSTLTADGLVIYDATPTSKPLIAYVDFGEDMMSVSGPLDVTFSSIGIAALFL